MERIGEYLVKRLVGEGGMGKVYEAEERLSKRPVALKVLHPDLAGSEEGRAQFIGEMSILSRLDHPNIVRCLACSEHDGKLVMALEFLSGRTLRQVIGERGLLPWDEAVAVATSVARGLAAAHSQDPPVIHRDLKPENIMILDGGGVKVMDFGIAKVIQAMSRHTTHSVGTLQYMSPEQIDATGLDQRSDYYCLGLVLYEMLTGTPPFYSESPRELLNLQCTEPAPTLPDAVRRGLPRGIETLLYRLLEKNAEDRPGTAEELLAALEPFAPADEAGPVVTRAATPANTGGATVAPVDTTPVVSAAPTGRPVAANTGSGAPALSEPINTVQLIERARADAPTVSTGVAIAVIVVMSLLAGLVTYFVRTAGG